MPQKNFLKLLLLTLVFTVPSFISLLILPFFTFHDEVQIVNLHQYFKAMDLGQFPPRWAPDMHFNAGSPFPEFNYQLPYYLGYLLHQFPLSITVIFKILLGIGLVGGAVGMYLLAGQFTTPLWAFIAATIYTYTPYRAVSTYVRGTLGEVFALALFPWVFWALYRLKSQFRASSIILASVCASLLVLSHQLAAILGFPFICLFILGDSLLRHDFKSLLRQIAALIIAALISSYYWLPILIEQKLIEPSSPFNFYDHFPFLFQFLYSPFRYGASVEGPGDYLSFQLGFVNIAIIIAAALGFIYFWKKTQKAKTHYLLISIMASFFIVIFLMNIRSSFFWRVFPFTQLVQFPWRLLMLTGLFTPIIFAIISTHFPKKISAVIAIVTLFFALYPNINYFQPGEVFNRDDNYFFHRFLPNTYLQSGEKISAEYLNHTEDYVPLPVGAKRPTELPERKVTAIRSLEVTVLDDNPFHYHFGTGQPHTQPVVFNSFYFPGWRATVDGDKVPLSADDHGLITFEVPIGKHDVQVIFDDSPIRQTANRISLITLIVLLEILLFDTLAHTDRIRVKV